MWNRNASDHQVRKLFTRSIPRSFPSFVWYLYSEIFLFSRWTGSDGFERLDQGALEAASCLCHGVQAPRFFSSWQLFLQEEHMAERIGSKLTIESRDVGKDCNLRRYKNWTIFSDSTRCQTAYKLSNENSGEYCVFNHFLVSRQCYLQWFAYLFETMMI